MVKPLGGSPWEHLASEHLFFQATDESRDYGCIDRLRLRLDGERVPYVKIVSAVRLAAKELASDRCRPTVREGMARLAAFSLCNG